MALRTRIALLVALTLTLGFLTWARLTKFGIFGGDEAAIAALVTCLLTGILVRRWWALLAVLGPFAVLAVLELTGYYTHAYLEWGERPLTAPPGIFSLLVDATLISLGIALRNFCEWVGTRRSELSRGVS